MLRLSHITIPCYNFGMLFLAIQLPEIAIVCVILSLLFRTRLPGVIENLHEGRRQFWIGYNQPPRYRPHVSPSEVLLSIVVFLIAAMLVFIVVRSP